MCYKYVFISVRLFYGSALVSGTLPFTENSLSETRKNQSYDRSWNEPNLSGSKGQMRSTPASGQERGQGASTKKQTGPLSAGL